MRHYCNDSPTCHRSLTSLKCTSKECNIWDLRPEVCSDGLFVRCQRSDNVKIVGGAITRRGDAALLVDSIGSLFVLNFETNKYFSFRNMGDINPNFCFAVGRYPNLDVLLQISCRRSVRSPDNNSNSIDIVAINADSGNVVSILSNSEEFVYGVAISFCNSMIVIYSKKTIARWNRSHGWSRLNSPYTTKYEIAHVLFLLDNNSIVISDTKGWIHILDLSSGNSIAEFCIPTDPDTINPPYLTCLAVSDDGRFLFGGCSNAPIIYGFNLKTYQLEFSVNLMRARLTVSYVVHIAFLSTIGAIAALTDDGAIRILDCTFQRELYCIGELNHRTRITSFSVDADGRLLCAILSSGQAAFFDLDIIESDRLGALGTPSPAYESRSLRFLDLNFPNSIVSDKLRRSDSKGPRRDPKKFNIFPTESKSVYVKAQAIDAVKMKKQVINPLLFNFTGYTKRLNSRRLKLLLASYGEYPSSHRPIIWRFLLQLPENANIYSGLVSEGMHPIFINLRSKYQNLGDALFRRLEQTLSALARWCPLFSDVDYLPTAIFPFVKIFHNDCGLDGGGGVVAFEAILTVLLNICHDWFEYHPNAPVDMLRHIDMILHHFDPELFYALQSLHASPVVYVWPLLRSFFVEVLTKANWLRLWDHVVLYRRNFYYSFLFHIYII